MESTASTQDLVKQAQRCVRKQDYAQAIELFQRVIEQEGPKVETVDGLATAYFLSGNDLEAAAQFLRAANLDPRLGRPLINLGAVYNRLGQYQQAVDAIRKGLSREKRSAQGFYNLGLAYRGLNQSSMAVSAYREAIRIDPQMAEAHQNLGNVFVDMGNFQQAILHYKKALEINPDFDRAKRGLAQAERGAADAKTAISPFGRLVDENAAHGRALPEMHRDLSEEERQADRAEIHRLATEAHLAAEAWHQQIRSALEPAVLALNRAVADTSNSKAALMRVCDDYAAAVESTVDLRKQLRRKLLELRAHEELMNTPEIKAP